MKKKTGARLQIQESMDSFVKSSGSAPKSTQIEAKQYPKNSFKYAALKEKITVLAVCTSIPQNVFQTKEFKSYIAECDAMSAASIQSRPILT